MKRPSKPEKCKPGPHPLGRQTRQTSQPLVNNGESVDKDRSWHCFGESAPPHMVHAVARGPNNPTKYLDKAKPCPQKNHTIHVSIFSSKVKGGNNPNTN